MTGAPYRVARDLSQRTYGDGDIELARERMHVRRCKKLSELHPRLGSRDTERHSAAKIIVWPIPPADDSQVCQAERGPSQRDAMA